MSNTPANAYERLGAAQKGVLRSMNSHRGRWDGGSWNWGSQAETLRILGTLQKRGLVKEMEDGAFELTDLGRQAIRALVL